MSGSTFGRSTFFALSLAFVAALASYGIAEFRPSLGSLSVAEAERPAQAQIPEEKQVDRGGTAQAPPASNPVTADSTAPSPLTEVPGTTYPVWNLASKFASLADKAEHGDLTAARTLAQALQTCSGIPKTFEELDKAVAGAHRPDLTPESADLEQRNLDYKKGLFNQCVGITPEEDATYSKWIGLLAEAGDTAARLQYVWAARPLDEMAADYDKKLADYKINAARYIQSEIDAGNPEGLLVMAFQYKDIRIILNGKSVTALYAPDPGKAYSYLYAYALSGAEQVNAETTSLARLQAQMTPDQLQTATTEGMQIYDQCCKSR